MKYKKSLVLIIVLIMGISINVYADNTCQGMFSQDLIDEVKSLFHFIQIIVPILLTVLTMFDFAKAVFVQDKDGLNKAKNNFVKRAVAALVVFFAPYIITAIMGFVNDIIINGADCVNQVK